MTSKILILPGDGIGPEVMKEVEKVISWFNLNKVEQVIGRATRQKSHSELNSKKRNVVIYLHASYNDKMKFKSADEKNYKIQPLVH